MIRIDLNGDGILEYVILDINWKEWEFYSIYIVDMETELLRFRGIYIYFFGGRFFRVDVKCWFVEGKICRGGKEWKIIGSNFGLVWVTRDFF